MSSPSQPRVSVVIVHWNTPELLDSCLHHLEASCEDMEMETLVVDNNSEDSGRLHLKEKPGLKIIRNSRNRGFAAAANQGAAMARGELLLFLNTEVSLPASSLSHLVSILTSYPELVAVAPVRISSHGREFPGMRFLNPLNQAASLLGLGGHGWLARRWPHVSSAGRKPVEVDWLRASTLLIRRRQFADMCGFDEGYFFYGEDEDLCWRLALQGYRVAACAHLAVVDPGGASVRLAGQEWGARELCRGQMRFVRRRAGRLALLLFRLSTAVALAIKLAFTWLSSEPKRRKGQFSQRQMVVMIRSLWSG